MILEAPIPLLLLSQFFWLNAPIKRNRSGETAKWGGKNYKKKKLKKGIEENQKKNNNCRRWTITNNCAVNRSSKAMRVYTYF